MTREKKNTLISAYIADKERKHHDNNKDTNNNFYCSKKSSDNQITIFILRFVAIQNPITIIQF